MISVFNTFPLQVGAGSFVNPVIQRATSAAAEAVNEIIWLIEADC